MVKTITMKILILPISNTKPNEAENRHTENAVALARKFGTKQEHENMLDIYRPMERGYIEQDEQMARDDIIKKYYNNHKKILMTHCYEVTWVQTRPHNLN